jgi:hypothetical protein
LAIGGAVVYLAWSIHWARSHPASAAALRVRQGDGAARLEVIRELSRLGPDDPGIALPALAEAMSDPEPANRAEAVSGTLPTIQRVARGGAEPDGVEAAILALVDRLADPQPAVRAKAVEALGLVVVIWQGTPRALALDRVASALGAIADDPDPLVRAMAVRGLGPIGRRTSEDPPPRLVAALDDPSEAVRTAAARGLGIYRGGLARLLPALIRAAEATRPECRPAYLSVLREIRPRRRDFPSIEELVLALASALDTRDREVRAQVLATLGAFRNRAREAAPALIRVLLRPAGAGDGADTDVLDVPRGSAAAALGELAPGGPLADEAIAALTQEFDRDGSIPTAEALGRFGPAARSAAPALLRELQRARDRKVPYAVAAFAEALGRIAAGTPEGEKALTILIDSLDKEDKNAPAVHRMIAAAGGFGPRAAALLPRLRELTKCDAPQVQEAAGQAITAIEGPGR